jgi:hypothetical protein
MSINIHVNASLAVATAGGASANFGVPIFVTEHTVTANRQDGPYSSLAAVEAAGFTAAAAAAAHAWASAVFAQNPRASQVLIGRRASGESLPAALAAIEAVNPAAFYAINIELNTANEIMALATWTETRSKIAIAQSSAAAILAGTASEQQVSTFTVGGTTDGVYSIAAYNAWTGALVGTASYTASGDTAAQIATALRSAWDLVAELAAISEPAAGTGDDVEITFDGLGNGYTFVIVAASSMTESTPAFVQNVLELGSALAFNRTAVIYHDSDAEYLDAAWTARCLSFNLDAPDGAAIWAYHRVSGVTATRLTDAQKAQLLTDSGNYYAPITYTSGVDEAGVTYKGRMLSGRAIDITTTIDVTQARLEEALLLAFIRASSFNSKIPMSDDGIQLLAACGESVLAKLVRAGHYLDDGVSELTARRTPYIDAPLLSSLSAAQRAARRVTLTGEAVFAGAIESVGDSATVGLSIDLSF